MELGREGNGEGYPYEVPAVLLGFSGRQFVHLPVSEQHMRAGELHCAAPRGMLQCRWSAGSCSLQGTCCC